MNNFGGKWTAEKIKVFMKYLHAYMQILKKYPEWPLVYFDGFAGSGEIQTKEDEIDLLEGVATQVLSLTEPRGFDMFYFVEKDEKKAVSLQKMIDEKFPAVNNIYVACDDCNKKLLGLAGFLKRPENSNYRGVVFIDPFGMQVKWESLQALKGLHLDLWILVPTGSAINRMIGRKEKSPENWFKSLGDFFGVPPIEIEKRFYRPNPQMNLFSETDEKKIDRASEEAAALYKERLNTIFKFVSEPLVMKNRNNAIMFHFFMASNVEVAMKIANDIVKITKK
jgi:three-Cys-motif partner protein